MPVVVLTTLLVCAPFVSAPGVPGVGSGAAVRMDPARYMGVERIQPGMTGNGRTVLKGLELAEFKVTVVDVMRNWGPKQDVILVRCAGANLEHSGIIRGMSGSPVYLNDPDDGGKPKMIGAIAYGWTWNKDPIAGVQPIEQMLSITGFREGGKPAGQARGGDGGGLGTVHASMPGPVDPSAESRYAMLGFVSPLLRRSMDEPPAPQAEGDLQPLMTPLLVGTANRGVMDYLRRQVSGTRLVPLAAAGGGKAPGPMPKTFVPGTSLVVPFLIGDLDMAGVGTVTEVIGDRVLGFGHSMMAEGSIELPMATGWVHTPISMLTASFKLASMGELAGTLAGDEETGVWGVTGKPARMIPVHVKIAQTDHPDREYDYQAMHHRMMTPWILGSGMMMSVLANRDLPREHTLRYRLTIEYEKLGPFVVENVSSMRHLYDVRSDLTEPMSMLMDNSFGQARVTRADMSISIEPKASVAKMERAELPRDVFKPGETVEVAVRWRPYRQKAFVRRYTLELPKDVPDGTYELLVGAADVHLAATRKEKPHLFRIESMGDMMSALRLIGSVRSDRVYMHLRTKRGGVAVGRTEMPELPSFRRQILDEAKLQAVESYAEPVLAEHAADFVAGGGQTFAIKVDRRADQ
ncbi:MAG: hypothetical protein JXQ73_12530 [Phycisphaerae bacterium]|nr:hypothetical protein [Phycisphaerae bacterium]